MTAPSLESDPNGIAALVTTLAGAVVVALHLTVSSEQVDSIGTAVAAVLALGSILVARVKAWAPNTVRALAPEQVPESFKLPPVPEVP